MKQNIILPTFRRHHFINQIVVKQYMTSAETAWFSHM